MKKQPIFLAATCLLCATLTGCGEEELSLEDYLSVSYSGANGYATANVDFDYIGFADAIASNSKENLSFFELAAAADNVKINTDGDIENLSNDDQFTVSFDWDADDAKKLGLKYIGNDKEFTVEGLEDVKEIDPFADLNIAYSGISPNGSIDYSATINTNNTLPFTFSYFFDPMSNLKNGDTIKVSIDDNNIQQKALQNGYLLTTTEKEFTVEGLPYLITTLDELSPEILDKMKKQSEDVINSDVTTTSDLSNSTYVQLLDYEFLGNYLLIAKDPIMFNNNNCCCVYKIHAKYKDNELYYYYCIQFHNIMILNDGSCSVELENYSVPFHSFIYESSHLDPLLFTGYENLESLFDNCVSEYTEIYNYESTVKE